MKVRMKRWLEEYKKPEFHSGAGSLLLTVNITALLAILWASPLSSWANGKMHLLFGICLMLRIAYTAYDHWIYASIGSLAACIIMALTVWASFLYQENPQAFAHCQQSFWFALIASLIGIFIGIAWRGVYWLPDDV